MYSRASAYPLYPGCSTCQYSQNKSVATLAGPEPPVPKGKFSAYLAASLVVAEMESRKLRHDPAELFTRAVQPALWLLVFCGVTCW
ncbi:hypothetical protein SDD30_10050 [Moorella naiadis]|uniref:hypothetical protein n=1 Tax=Moorella naiadis (nom. illeg.) TaxID=3093670 RepID=UPI003D9C8565